MTPLIFVYDGILPDYSYYSLELSKKYSNKKIILLTTKNNQNFSKKFDHYYIEDFYKFDLSKKINFSNYHKNFWNGFWIKTIERFFILETFCKKKNIDSFFHAELDNIVFNLDDLDNLLDQHGKKLFFTKDRYDRGIASLIYVNSLEYLKDFCNFIIDNLGNDFINEMNLLGNFSNIYSKKCGILPNELHYFQSEKMIFKTIDSMKINGIFDGAMVGTYLFGTDPRIVDGIVFNKNEPKNADNQTNFFYGNLLFYFNSSKKEFLIEHKITKKKVKIYNLHVHSKLFKKLSKEKTFQRILDKSNLNKSSLMTLNLKKQFQEKFKSLIDRLIKLLTIKF